MEIDETILRILHISKAIYVGIRSSAVLFAILIWKNAEAICQILEGSERWFSVPKGMPAMLCLIMIMAAFWLIMNP